jgi:hypothetical protein
MRRARLIAIAVAIIAVGLFFWLKPAPKLTGIHLTTGLVAYWTPDGHGQDSGHRFNGVLTGAVKTVSVESGQTAFAFNGGKIIVSNAPDLNVRAKQDFSIAARIRPIQTNTPFGVMSIVEKRQVAGITGAVGYSLHLEDGRLACQIAPAMPWNLKLSDFTSPSRIKAAWQRRKQIVPMQFQRFISNAPDLRDGHFHDVALTVERKSATGGKLFVDGQLVLTFDPTKLPQSLVSPAPLLIGGHPDPTLDCGFKGHMDYVRIYSRAISPEEVQALAEHGEAEKPLP